ncbi:MAG: undecaprenyldiphospho-muramoylpentapeptide beta-N-acetylglucosaminyltransferase [[Clostridium] spiroforme]|uniref:UDP-N-acetylglucosamine--N-acetylmuramyl-(pentapeptide) pyrophosphoryl-undecaprenol N-acetylglucosamine transferase n=1 Tax=Thomasclavelia spiroformis TaxID=29348 RepID=A0A943EGK0_9FIRM|nr:undecaprenyldiphospho-muramoylpentapeptide beta-N-acetylglucosaminyltransferase [Thomasclavelia spiroformis]MBS5587571.1 undecaprenyldiphospho-muramoylpentapeptide beta-N-acetylglucosaminyltransferase [Thomasclavelia spiroformis]
MRVIIGAGGTGGHLYPALALVEYIKEKEPESEFLFVGTKDRLESQIVPSKGYNYVGLNVHGLVGNPIKKAIAATVFVKSIFTAKKVVKKFKPDIVIGFGGYPSASVVEAAYRLGYKTMIHEQNSIIGLTNKILIKHVDKIVCCYDLAYQNFPKEKTYKLGNPRASVITSIKSQEIFSKYGLDKHKPLVTIVMGSLGSKSVNEKLLESLRDFEKKDYQVLYVTGKNYYEEMKNKAGKLNHNVKLVPYIDDMPSLLKNTTLIVSRAGASTMAEISAIGVPSILIPSPYVASNHQEYNARELSERNGALMILEKDLNSKDFVDKVDYVINNQIVQESLRKNSLALGKPNALADMYKLIKDTLGA